MKKYFFFLAAAVAFTSFSAKAQDDQDQAVKPKAKHKAKEIIIRENNPDVQGKTIIVIEDGKVTVNGKPSSDWSGGEVTVHPSGDGDEIFMDRNPYAKVFSYRSPQAMKLNMLTDMGSGVRLGVYSSANEKGAEVTSVIDSSAAFKAGLKEGDIITKVDNSPISDPEALSKVIRDHKAGDVVTVHYLRGVDEKEAKVTLEKNKAMEFKDLLMQPGMNFKIDGVRGWNRPRLGANIQDMEDSSGVKVLHVNPESPAAKAGLQKDDVITAIDGKRVKGVDEAMDVLGDNEDKYNYPLTVTRGGSSMTIQVKIPRELKSGTL